MMPLIRRRIAEEGDDFSIEISRISKAIYLESLVTRPVCALQLISLIDIVRT
jgi:hypothetical protein